MAISSRAAIGAVSDDDGVRMSYCWLFAVDARAWRTCHQHSTALSVRQVPCTSDIEERRLTW